MNLRKLVFLSLVMTAFLATFAIAVQPFGAQVTEEATSRAQMDAAENDSALAGNVTELTIFGYSVTQTWQGYFGNVSGTVMLADSSDNVMYNWSLASPEGEVYATTIGTVNWTGIACFDLATNHGALETLFNITSDDVDGINETFSDSTNHDLFYTNNVQFSAGDCAATNIYDSTGAGVGANFQEVLQTDGSSATAVIFTSILDEEGPAGFDGAQHDFEMLVLEDGHGTDAATTTYFFYVELE